MALISEILLPVFASTVSINILIITFLLGRYQTLLEERRTPAETRVYFRSTILMLVILWAGTAGIGSSLITMYTSINFRLLTIGLFLVQSIALPAGMTWIANQILRGPS